MQECVGKTENQQRKLVTTFILTIITLIGTGGHTCVPNSQLQAAAILGEPVGFGTGSGSHSDHCSGRPLPGNLDCRPQQINLLPVHVLHIVLNNIKVTNVRI